MKKHSTILNLSLLAFVILFSSSCKNKDCKKDGSCPPEYYKFPLGEAKSYLYALKGSYWIYKNTATNELDTQTCIGFMCDTIIAKGDIDNNRTKHITVEYEHIVRTIVSKFSKLSYYDETNGYNPNQPRELITGLDRHANNGATCTVFWHPFKVIDGDATIYKGLDSTLALQGKSYNNVASFEVKEDGIDEMNCLYLAITTTYYWAKDVGLIKKNVKNCNYSWELIEYNIIK